VIAVALAGLACRGYAMWRRRILSPLSILLAFIVVASSAQGGLSFTDDFSSSSPNGNLSVPTGWTFGTDSTPNGVAQNNNRQYDPESESFSTPRTYVSTVASNYSTVDFVYEVTFSVAGDIAFVGIGSGQPNANFYDEPYGAFFLRQFPDSFEAGKTGWTISTLTAPANPSENIFPSSGSGDGTYRAQLLKSGNSLTLGIDVDYSGGPFAADFAITKSLLTDLSFLDSTNARLFFGTAGSATTFDDLVVTAVPEPSTYAMALAGLACGGWHLRRRRRA